MSDYMEPRDQHKKQGYIWVLIALAVIFLLWAYSEISNAADLKCVTIKFKNDSELKLKAQWFINAPVTKVNCRWLVMATDDYTATVTWYKEMGRQIRESPEWHEHGYFELYSCDTLLLDRQLLFPPQIRKEPVINLTKTDSTQTTVTPRWKISCENGDTIWHVPCGDSAIMGHLYTTGPYYRSDTTEGETLLWYEER